MSKSKIVNYDDNIIATVQAHTEAAEGNALLVQTASGSTVLGPLTNAELRATAVPIIVEDPSSGDQAIVMTGPFTGEKGLRVFIGPTDPISDIPVFMDFGQHQVHEGESYGAQWLDTTPNTASFGITIGDYGGSKVDTPHLIMHLQTYGGAFQVDLYEGATFTGGALMPSFNRNRNSTNTPDMTIHSGVTIGTAGTLLPHSFIAAAGEKQGDTNRSNDEIILKENTIYRVTMTELQQCTRVILHFEWYEDLGV